MVHGLDISSRSVEFYSKQKLIKPLSKPSLMNDTRWYEYSTLSEGLSEGSSLSQSLNVLDKSFVNTGPPKVYVERIPKHITFVGRGFPSLLSK